MANIDGDAVLNMCAGLTKFLEELACYLSSQGPDPKTGSQADLEQKTASRSESIISAHAGATLLLEAAGDHLSAFLKTITQPIEVLACWTCIRGVQEACALSAWLCDPSIDSNTRIGRIFAWRFEGLDQQMKFGRVAAVPQNELDTAASHIEETDRIAVSLGFTPFRNSNNKITAIGRHMPAITVLIGQVLEQEQWYRLLSGVAHGHFWAQTQLGYCRQSEQSIPGGKVIALEKVVRPENIMVLGNIGLKAIARALWNKAQYFDWDMNPLEEIIDNAADTTLLKSQCRFWRSYSVK